MIARFYRWLVGDKWVVRRSCWPYQEGFATYNPHRKMVLDSGISREQAQIICDELNRKPENQK
jgi:hypothetical protein